MLAASAGGLSAHDLPLMFQERYLHVTGALSSDAPRITDPGISAFSGDFPLVIHAGNQDRSVYSGVPLFIPAFISFGRTNQIGYYDAYRSSTPISLLSAGWRTPGMEKLAGPFLSWGWRHGSLTGGASYHVFEQVPAAYLGASFHYGGAALELSTEGIAASLNLRTGGHWGITASLSKPWEGTTRISLGFGVSRREHASDALEEFQWDMRLAHRGSLEHAPENTMAAFTYALKQPRFTGIELDVQRTRDGEFVVIHDPVLIRYTGEMKFISQLTYEELKTRDLGAWIGEEFSEERIVHLSELASLANKHPDVYWLIELKSYQWSEEDVTDFLAACDELFAYPRSIFFITLNHRLLEIMQRHTERPVGLQLDSRRFMLFLSDHLPPVSSREFQRAVGDQADFFTIISSKYSRMDAVTEAADSLGIPAVLWDFHDDMYGYIPQKLKDYPLGLPKMEEGRLFPSASQEN